MDKKQILTAVATNIRALMNEKGLTSTQLSAKCKISSGTISKIVNGTMSITLPMAFNLAEGLGVDVSDILEGLTVPKEKKGSSKKISIPPSDQLSIGILSINNKRITCIKNASHKIVGSSELERGLDLTETSGNLIQLIQESINAALPNGATNEEKLKNAKLNLVTQSYEFEDTRSKFAHFAQKTFKEVLLLSDWQITYLAAFQKTPGISLITDKGVSLSYKHNGLLKKLGGWKFPVYDLGGENWLGVETIRHTIEAFEGYTPMSKLAHSVLAKYSGKIEKITETCFKGSKDPDVYCLFTELLLRSYLEKDAAAQAIIEHGFQSIYRSVERVDEIIGKQLPIALNGSLAGIYKHFFKKGRLITSSSDAEKTSLLADVSKDFLLEQGIKTDG